MFTVGEEAVNNSFRLVETGESGSSSKVHQGTLHAMRLCPTMILGGSMCSCPGSAKKKEGEEEGEAFID